MKLTQLQPQLLDTFRFQDDMVMVRKDAPCIYPRGNAFASLKNFYLARCHPFPIFTNHWNMLITG